MSQIEDSDGGQSDDELVMHSPCSFCEFSTEADYDALASHMFLQHWLPLLRTLQSKVKVPMCNELREMVDLGRNSYRVLYRGFSMYSKWLNYYTTSHTSARVHGGYAVHVDSRGGTVTVTNIATVLRRVMSQPVINFLACWDATEQEYIGSVPTTLSRIGRY
jgi:hypothetical protein